MPDDVSTDLLTLAYDPTAGEGPSVHLGCIAITDEVIARVRETMDELVGMRDDGRDVAEIVLNDRQFEFLDLPKEIVRGTYDEDDPAWEAVLDIVERGAEFAELPPGRLGELASAMHMMRKDPVRAVVSTRVGPPSVEWRTAYASMQVHVDTPYVRQASWLRFYLRATDDREVFRQRFHEVCRVEPMAAFKVLDGALDYDDGTPAPLDPLTVLAPGDLAPLLSHDHQPWREKALRALGRLDDGDLERSDSPPKGGRSR